MSVESLFQIAPGTKEKRTLPAGEAGDLQVWVLQGAQPGPTLVVTAGVHGCEYVGMLTARKLFEQLDPGSLKGRLLILPLVNAQGFLAGQQLVPSDGGNLNRAFPAPQSGTATQQIARAVQDHIYPEADFLVDLHGGGPNEDMTPLVFFPQGIENTDYIRQAAAHLDVGYRVLSKADDGLYSCAARTAGIPAMLVEIGCMGLWDPEEVDRCFRSVLSLMGFLGMGPEAKVNGFQQEVLETLYESAPQAGMWVSPVKAGQSVKAGDLLGTLTDLEGSLIEELRAQFDGTVLYHGLALGVKAGELLVAYGRCQ